MNPLRPVEGLRVTLAAGQPLEGVFSTKDVLDAMRRRVLVSGIGLARNANFQLWRYQCARRFASRNTAARRGVIGKGECPAAA
jgi:hypothetical protein